MKRSGYSIKKLTAKLLCAVLTVGMLSGAAPINVYAEENVKTEKMSEGGGVQSAGTGAGGTRRAESVPEQPGLPKEPSENDLPSGEDAAGNQGETQENEEKGKTDNGEDKTENDEVEDSEEEDGGAENNEAEDDGSVTDGDAILSEEEIMPTKEDGQAVPLEGHIHDGVVYTAWPETDRLPDAAGNYYLTENVTLTDTWEVPAGTTNLCLNGKTIALIYTVPELLKHVIRLRSDQSVLSLFDCEENGRITGTQIIGVDNNGTFNMYGGKITDGQGGGVDNRKGGIFNLYGGEISNNRNYGGGGVTNYGIFNMYGGKIKNNICLADPGYEHNSRGGGVMNWGTFNMYGGEIVGNSAFIGGGVTWGIADGIEATMTIGGDAVIYGNYNLSGEANNLSLFSWAQTHKIVIDSNHPLSESANIGITSEQALLEGQPKYISGSNAADYSSRFHSDNPDYAIQNGADNAVLLVIPIPHTHKWSPDWSNDETHHWHECTAAGCSVTDKADKDGFGVHTEDGGTITKQPTETEEGETVYRCSICGYEMRKEAIPATGGGETPEPDEGDKPGPGDGDKPDTGEDDKPIREEDNKPDGSGDLSEENVIVQTGDPVIGNTETGNQDGVSDKDNITIPASESNVPDESAAPAEPFQDAEPKTGNLSPVELYATLAMISGLTYLLLYFTDRSGGMTEETKKELVSKLIRWAKRGKTMRRLIALIVIFALLVYYHSIGKQSAIEWKEA